MMTMTNHFQSRAIFVALSMCFLALCAGATRRVNEFSPGFEALRRRLLDIQPHSLVKINKQRKTRKGKLLDHRFNGKVGTVKRTTTLRNGTIAYIVKICGFEEQYKEEDLTLQPVKINNRKRAGSVTPPQPPKPAMNRARSKSFPTDNTEIPTTHAARVSMWNGQAKAANNHNSKPNLNNYNVGKIGRIPQQIGRPRPSVSTVTSFKMHATREDIVACPECENNELEKQSCNVCKKKGTMTDGQSRRYKFKKKQRIVQGIGAGGKTKPLASGTKLKSSAMAALAKLKFNKPKRLTPEQRQARREKAKKAREAKLKNLSAFKTQTWEVTQQGGNPHLRMSKGAYKHLMGILNITRIYTKAMTVQAQNDAYQTMISDYKKKAWNTHFQSYNWPYKVYDVNGLEGDHVDIPMTVPTLNILKSLAGSKFTQDYLEKEMGLL